MDDEEPPPPPDFVLPSGATQQGPAGAGAGAVPAAPTDWGAMLTSLANAAQQALAAAAPQQEAPPQQQATAPASAAAPGEQAAGVQWAHVLAPMLHRVNHLYAQGGRSQGLHCL